MPHVQFLSWCIRVRDRGDDPAGHVTATVTCVAASIALAAWLIAPAVSRRHRLGGALRATRVADRRGRGHGGVSGGAALANVWFDTAAARFRDAEIAETVIARELRTRGEDRCVRSLFQAARLPEFGNAASSDNESACTSLHDEPDLAS
jgi:hypothetical protein